MKNLLLVSFFATVLLSSSECGNKEPGGTLKGKLEIAGICMNYTISVVEGNPGKDAVESSWTDETTNKSYTHAFRLGNPCDFPSTIKQGDEFYFRIDTTKGKECAVCMAYYPTPSKSLSIKVIEK